ncbi:chitinase domain-containing protein [Anaeramoeba flamelloides]|uniref:Chitinase domain-containing protein 1 n=1 Tax=Anaeramoeba flamelloides TaxID=1746091 RepID=A0AAV7YQZ4_9EUKA|nr:chitinase domain-containing protein [Anaeramoeba flamelloides]
MIGFWNLLLLINAVLFLNYCVSCSDFERLIYVTGNERSLNSVAENYQKIDIASPQCYTTNKYGELSGGVDPILQKLSDEGKIKLLPLVMNKGFDDEILTVLLRNQTAQDLFLGSLVKEAKKHNFIGWQYDFEHLLITNRDVYTQFVAKSNLRFKQEKLNFSICVCPRSKDYTGSDPYLKFMWEEWNGGYDFLQLSKHVDFLAYMTYSEHTGATVSGPIASINWVQACVNFALSLGVPASKLSLGIPFYHGYWKTVFDKNKGIHVNGSSPSYLEILKILKDNNASLEWDTNYKVNKASFMIDYKSHHVFVEDKDSLVVKLLVLKDNNLRGICCWVAGQEDPAVWDVL